MDINIPTNLERLKDENLKILKQVISNKFNDLRKNGLLWIDRITTGKMKILVKIHFLFMMLPLKINEKELKDG